MKTGLIIAAGAAVSPALLQQLAAASETVIAVDGGYRHCLAAGVRPALLLGDMDSLPPQLLQQAQTDGVPVERLPCEKDDTDTLYALRRLVEEGARQVDITCALGGRLDHLVANLQALLFAARQGIHCRLLSEDAAAEALLPGSYRIQRGQFRFFSLFSLAEQCEGVCIRRAKYPLTDYRLENSFPIGVSNAFLEEEAEVSFASGALLLIRSRDVRA